MSTENGGSVERYAVEWFVPNTRIGDGRPHNGVHFIDAATPGEAWDRFADRVEPIGEIVLRVIPADDLGSVPPLRDIIDAIGVGLAA